LKVELTDAPTWIIGTYTGNQRLID
jgi:hypothetical protein